MITGEEITDPMQRYLRGIRALMGSVPIIIIPYTPEVPKALFETFKDKSGEPLHGTLPSIRYKDNGC